MSLDSEAPKRVDLAAKLGADNAGILSLAGKTGRERSSRVFLVGGLVRDLYIDVGSVDLDIAVEGDGLAFARKLAELFKAQIVEYRRFLTATLTLDGGVRLDIATARTETYERPGSLPIVKPSSMEDDMRRRDFTINAMALSLDPDSFGEPYDPFAGLRDVSARLIRVLHGKSFMDDPTRIIRAQRFASRLSFELEPGTASLVKAAVESRVFDFVSADRLREELFLGFWESDPAAFLRGLDALGALSPLVPGAVLDADLPGLLDSAVALNSIVEKGPTWDPALVGLLLLLRGAREADARQAAEKLGLGGRGSGVLAFAPELPRLAARIESAAGPGAVHEALSGLPLEACLAAIVLSGGEKQRGMAVEYLWRGRRVKTELGGDDLVAMGFAEGPVLGRILEELLKRKLDGEVKDRKSEEDYVLKHFRPPGGEAVS